MTTTELRKRERVTGPRRAVLAEDLAKRYVAGASIRDLAADLGRSYGFVHRILEPRVAFRPRGGSHR